MLSDEPNPFTYQLLAMSQSLTDPAAKTGRPVQVLLVEDSSDDAELLERELIRGGLAPRLRRVETAAAMEDALALECWDLVVSDFCLPGFSADGALRTLKSSGQDLPFFVVSGVVREEQAAGLIRAGAVGFWEKAALGGLVPLIERRVGEARHRLAHRRTRRDRPDDATDVTLMRQALERRTREVEGAALENYRLKKQLEESLRQEARARQSLRQVLSAVSQDLRGSLAVMAASADMLAMKINPGAGSGLERHFDAIQGAVGRMVALMAACSADEQLESSGRLILHKRSVDLAQLIARSVAHYREISPRHRFVVECDAPLTAWGESDLIGVVIDHLLANAVTFSPDGGVVGVAARRDRDSVRIEITDCGIGIKNNELRTVFHRLRRGLGADNYLGRFTVNYDVR